MTIESATYISDLNTSNPGAADAKSEGDDHIRLVKATLKTTFTGITGAVTATHTALNNAAAGTFGPLSVTTTNGNFQSTSDVYGIISKPLTTAGYSGMIAQNNAGTRKWESIFLDSTAATTYGVTAGNHVINAALGTNGHNWSCTDLLKMRLDQNGNVILGVAAAATSAVGAIAIGNCTAPSANIVGGTLYVEAGVLKYRGSAGSITVLGAA